MESTSIWVGIDISSSHLDVYVHPRGQSYRLDNTQAGIQELIQQLQHRLEGLNAQIEQLSQQQAHCFALAVLGNPQLLLLLKVRLPGLSNRHRVSQIAIASPNWRSQR